MPVLAKFCGIIIRMLYVQQLGARIHAFYQNSEIVISLWPLKIVQGEGPAWVKEKVLLWAAEHQNELIAVWHRHGQVGRANHGAAVVVA